MNGCSMNRWNLRQSLRESGLKEAADANVPRFAASSETFFRDAVAEWNGTGHGRIELDSHSASVTKLARVATGHRPIREANVPVGAEFRALEQLGTTAPRVGDQIAGFHILARLGRGAQGRVYLATQTELADRPVVLKVSPLRGGEHRSLARLQHTNIVPILSSQDLPERGLRVLCLPYMGGTTLEHLLLKLMIRPVRERSGRQLQIGRAHV